MKSFIKKIRTDRDFRAVFLMSLSAMFNLVYGCFSLVIGLMSIDPYFISSGIYYLILALIEGVVILKRKSIASMSPYGFFLMALDLSLSIMTFYTLFTGNVKAQHEIAMIAVATYSFARIILAIRNFIKDRKSLDLALIIMRCISFSSALVGILSLTMSMMLTFGGEYGQSAIILIAATGLGVFIINICLAIYLIINKPGLLRKTAQKGD